METIFQLENGTKWAFYENTNNLYLQPLPPPTNTKPLLLADDYLHSPTSTQYSQNIYYAYHSISHTLKLGVAGNDIHTVILSDPGNLLDCRYLTLFVFHSTLYLCYMGRPDNHTDSFPQEPNYSVYIMDVLHERIPHHIIPNCTPGTTYQIIPFINSVGLLLSDKKLLTHKYYQSSDMVTFSQMYISDTIPVPSSNNNISDDIIAEYETTVTNYKKRIITLEEEYQKLFQLCENLQTEGKHWRQKYYSKKS